MDETAHLETDLPDVQEALRRARSGYDDVVYVPEYPSLDFPLLASLLVREFGQQ